MSYILKVRVDVCLCVLCEYLCVSVSVCLVLHAGSMLICLFLFNSVESRPFPLLFAVVSSPSAMIFAKNAFICNLWFLLWCVYLLVGREFRYNSKMLTGSEQCVLNHILLLNLQSSLSLINIPTNPTNPFPAWKKNCCERWCDTYPTKKQKCKHAYNI